MPNRLADATSPYLRSHAHQPVDWSPFDAEALARAAELDRPLFISIGYATCHWCHVMAEESFDDPEIAALLNASFVPIKVDREERPDLDATYLAATTAQAGHAGWPMSIFATPDGRPFYCGTYFPKTDVHGLPGFARLLGAMTEAWADQRAEVEAQADEVAAAVLAEAQVADRLATRGHPEGGLVATELLAVAAAELAQLADPTWGGFSKAPKFPRASYVELLLCDFALRGTVASAELACRTLDAMAAGGIYDHVRGGFARYSVDERWLVPHFEKLLCDQALLARVYLHGFQLTGERRYAQVVEETLSFMVRELGAEFGGLCAGLDADAAGREGSHVTWTSAELRAALATGGDETASLDQVREYYGLGGEPHFDGASIPHRPLGAPLEREPAMEAARQLLAEARLRRPQPSVDDQVLLEWNAMAAAVLAEAAGVLDHPHFADAARAIVECCLATLVRADGRLLRSFAQGRPSGLAGASDYAWLLEACTRLYELDGDPRWLGQACEVADALLQGFWDGEFDEQGNPSSGPGGFFSTGHDADVVLTRAKELFDGATPAAGSVAAAALGRLAALSGRARYRAVAEQLCARAAALLVEHPIAAADLTLAAVGLAVGAEVVLPGPAGPLLQVVRSRYLPGSVVVHGAVEEASPLLAERAVGEVYCCQFGTCSLPVHDQEAVEAELDRCLSLGAQSGRIGPW